VSGFAYLLQLKDGSPADPGAFLVNEPPGAFHVGEVFTGNGKFFRILAIDGPPDGDVPEAREWHGVWTVEPAESPAVS
jgi:hypothetical protein